ncbi:DUF1450 domain-containing protein [Vulgatibacter sp.]|uniref:DUF1450 domain-containing protein n=1 Tax=Vulgatibacter sp. TaxID=1971226 RepID=UPI0035671B36
MADCAAVKAQLCKTNLMRLGGAAAKAILDACKGAGIEVERRDCLQRCPQCNVAAIAIVDGMPVGAATGEELAEQIASLTP